jgi:hypothetical protein
MSTITIVRNDGLKVRTVRGKHYYVTIPNGTKAKVIKRTDDVISAERESRRWNGAQVWNDLPSAQRFLTAQELSEQAAVARHRKAFHARLGRQGDARRLAY